MEERMLVQLTLLNVRAEKVGKTNDSKNLFLGQGLSS